MLHIDSVKLLKFQGMWLNKIKYFELNDIRRYQLILGRNGCGKSRLMRILSLIAPNKIDFDEGGYRELTVTKDNVQYRLLCSRTKGGFKCTIEDLTNDTVLFDAVNPSVYNTAIKDMFNYDKEIHDLITGRVLFTDMKIPERKKWFSILSESDLTYALSYYKKSREHFRDFTGAIKTMRHDIGLLQPKVIENRDELEATRKRIDEMQRSISQLDVEIESSGADWSITDTSLDENDAKLESLSHTALHANIYISKEVADNDLDNVNSKLTAIDTTYEIRMSELNALVKKVEHATKIKNIDLTKLEDSIRELSADIAHIDEGDKTFPLVFDGELETILGASEAIKMIRPTIQTAIMDVNALEDVTDIPATQQSLAQQAEDVRSQIATNRNKLSMCEERLKHIQHTCDVTCPQCNSSFKPGIGENEQERIYKNIEHYNKQNTELEPLLDKLAERLRLYNVASQSVAQATGMMLRYKDNEVLTVLFTRLFEEDVFASKKPYLASLIDAFETDLLNASDRVRLTSRLERIKLDAEIIRANQNDDYTEIESRIETIEGELANLVQNREYWLRIRGMINDTNTRMAMLDEVERRLNEAHEERDKIVSVLERNIKVTILTEERDETWKLLIESKQRFEDMDRERMRLEDLETRLAETNVRKDAADKIVKALSPDGGILAQYLYQSITKVTDLMTGYVNSIWGYEMGIKPCGVKGTELDYKFPFYANDTTQLTEDVSLGSKAQQEVINFVFMLSVYQAVGLVGYPLFLDELGSGFDEGHKPKMIDFIKSLIDRAYHSQVFMVSHDPQTHFQLAHADVCVIDQNGISLPPTFNKNVIIKY